MSHQNNSSSIKLELRPTPVAVGVAKSIEAPIPPTFGMKVAHNKKDNWTTVDEIATATADMIAVAVNGINETVESVKAVGCTHVSEFNATVNKTNEDLKKFADDYVGIRKRHENKTGPIKSLEDRALSISVVEDYRRFQGVFNAVMGHTVIAFTEFALEAKDIQNAQGESSAQQQEAAK